jgi:hypothetical protein
MSRRGGFVRDPVGWRQFERSAMVGNAMEKVAQGIAAEANRQGDSGYYARQVVDKGGRALTPRAAAEVATDNSTYGDAKERRLIAVAYAYRVRGIG